ncbi:MAG: Acetate kinase [Pseudomonadales bacterium]|nr:Acetate kinase [Pseudomonadales bacterium]
MTALPVLVLNCGSSSLKYSVYEMRAERVLCSGRIERIGEGGADGGPPDHRSALAQALAAVPDHDAIVAVGHRVVHGGEHFHAATLIDDAALATLEQLDALAPLHNPANRLGIELAREQLPRRPQVAVFDTAFYHSLPAEAREYALPQAWRERGIRRYGFHGTSHRQVSREAASLLGKPLEALDLVTLHLGNGSSATAIRGGVAIDTSMGMTPLEGLVMGTRAGDLDAGVLLYLLRAGVASHELEHTLNHGCGLHGLCGSNDMRAVHALADAGDADAGRALAMYCYRVRKYIGAYLATLGRVDALVFTAGIGEHDARIRARILTGLEGFGIALDAARNAACHGTVGMAIHAASSRVAVLVIPGNEELEIAREVAALIAT